VNGVAENFKDGGIKKCVNDRNEKVLCVHCSECVVSRNSVKQH
jgi:hypothetical protein